MFIDWPGYLTILLSIQRHGQAEKACLQVVLSVVLEGTFNKQLLPRISCHLYTKLEPNLLRLGCCSCDSRITLCMSGEVCSYTIYGNYYIIIHGHKDNPSSKPQQAKPQSPNPKNEEPATRSCSRSGVSDRRGLLYRGGWCRLPDRP